MAEMSRFIQFNNEQIDARQMITYENLAQALSGNPHIHLTERQLMEFNPKEQTISMSVFWRHRTAEQTHLGRLSDIYLLAEGFWRHFSQRAWHEFQEEIAELNYPKFFEQQLIMAEEFRLMESVAKKRPGTKKAFRLRAQAYLATYQHQIHVHHQKGFLAEALLNYFYIALHEGSLRLPTGGIFDTFGDLLYKWQHVFDSQSTEETIRIIWALVPQIEEILKKDIQLDVYALLDQLEAAPFIPDHEHDGVCGMEEGSDEVKETIEETFRSWHRESQDDTGTHLRFELERGNEGKSLSDEAVKGQDGQPPTEVGTGGDVDATAKPQKEESLATKSLKKKYTKSGEVFGREHEQVIYQEKMITTHGEDITPKSVMEKWRLQQEPMVRALVQELRKRMAQKKMSRRTHLSYGRLDSKQLLSFVTENRPRPFYKKDAPSKPLDAVFGLLIDGSASMMDKMDETKQAVLLFHDVLRSLEIAHEMTLFYEDAYEATKEVQPNTFEWIHRLEDGAVDASEKIAAMTSHEDNRDGFAIRWMTERLKKRPEKHRFLLVFSDGEPSAFEYAQNGILDTAEAVIEAEKQGITVLHLFLNTSEPSEEQLQLFSTIYGRQSIVASDVAQFSDMTLRMLRKVLSLVVQSM